MSHTVVNLIPSKFEDLKKGRSSEYKKAVDHCISILKREVENLLLLEWCPDDIIHRAKENNMEITEKQANDIIRKMGDNHDCEYGVTWNTIDNYLDDIEGA